jgi:pyruvate/2-oxoglutarate dehydrogenase complex dihydrolipoamide acyltransferase (E2) component
MDSINHPQHYADNGYGVEAIDMMRRVFGDADVSAFCRLNAFKYRLRAGKKHGNSAEQDLAKERWYLAKLKELDAPAATDAPAPAPAPAPANRPAPAAATGKPTKWTADSVELLRSMSVKEAANHFGVSPVAIHAARFRLGIAKRKKKPAHGAKPAGKAKKTVRADGRPMNALEGINL